MAYADEVLADAPLAYYRLDEAAGPTLVDSSGSLRDGSWAGAPTFGAAPVILDGTSVDFTATGQYATVPYATWQDVYPLTVEAWVNFATQPSALRTIVSHTTGTEGWRFFIEWDYIGLGVYRDGSTTEAVLFGDPALTAGATHHVVGQFDSTGMRIYLDGALYATAAGGASINYGSSMPLVVGASDSAGAGGFFDGRVDEVAVYGAILSEARIAAHHEVGTVAPVYNGSDTFNRSNGRNRSGTGFANQDEPVAAVPATLTREPIRVMAQTLPTPTLEKGRPV